VSKVFGVAIWLWCV